MKIAVASGKGGTGKTTVATNLAWVASDRGHGVAYLDCDVEEPNGHLFLNPRISVSEPATRLVPEVDEAKCTYCGRCGEICQFSAIVCLGRAIVVNPDMCHACGGCKLVCPTGAITEVPREMGRIDRGDAAKVQFVRGLLNVGEAMSPPLIRKVLAAAPHTDLVLIDAPPGTSCPVIASLRGSDYVLLVTEPTPFGLHDLKLAVDMVRALKLPFGVVINRADSGDERTRAYCASNRIPILLEIPDDRRVAEAYSRGELACVGMDEYREAFANLLNRILEVAQSPRQTGMGA
ncbi:MAG: P-loop NTPase [Phycisphaerales bacterium]|nr:P-loop NTPase [Phycisphaerales bacterium]